MRLILVALLSMSFSLHAADFQLGDMVKVDLTSYEVKCKYDVVQIVGILTNDTVRYELSNVCFVDGKEEKYTMIASANEIKLIMRKISHSEVLTQEVK